MTDPIEAPAGDQAMTAPHSRRLAMLSDIATAIRAKAKEKNDG